MSDIPELVQPYHKKWLSSVKRMDDTIRRGLEACQGTDQGMMDYFINIIHRHYEKYEVAWETFQDVVISSKIDSENFETTNDRVVNDQFECIKQLNEGVAKIKMVSLQELTQSQRSAPEMRVPEFYGSHEKWADFWEVFNSVIHSNRSIKSTIKFAHLKGSVKGEPARLIQGFELTEKNYLEAVKILKERYEDKDKNKRLLTFQLMDLKTPRHDLNEIRQFRDDLVTLQRSLKAYVDIDGAEWLIKEMLLRKIPHETRDFLYQLYKTPYMSSEQIVKGLGDLINLMESETNKKAKEANLIIAQSNAEKTQLPYKANANKPKAVWQAHTNTNTYRCDFCQEKHDSTKCPTFHSPKLRWNRLLELKVCTRCGLGDHFSRMCKRKVQCKSCWGAHLTRLCCANREPVPAGGQHTKGATSLDSVANVKTASMGKGGVALPTAIVKITKGENHLTVRGGFDSFSQCSFIHLDVLKRLNIPLDPKEEMLVSPFGKGWQTVKGQTVKLNVGLGGRRFTLKFFATDQVDMCLSSPGLKATIDDLKSKGCRLADPSATDSLTDVQIIIGADYFGKLVGRVKLVQGVNVFSSPGGYLIFGKLPCGNPDPDEGSLMKSVQVKKVAMLPHFLGESNTKDPPVHKLWELDSIGIQPEKFDRTEEKVLKEFANTIQYDDHKYSVRLPFKYEPCELPTNFKMALSQLKSLLKRLEQDVEKRSHYHRIIKDYESMDFIEQVKDRRIIGHYLPHHPVLKDSTTTPIRIVFNASATCENNLSLNDVLETGPSLTEKLVDSLVNFRQGRYAVCADISKAFLRVGLQPSERDFVRFLWVEDPESDDPKMITYRFKAVPFGTTSSPFLLQATLYRHLSLSQSPLKDMLLNSFYVDNFATTIDEDDKLCELFHETNRCLIKAGMPLQEWNSNCQPFNEWLDDETRKIEVGVLGINWSTQEDTINLRDVKSDPIPNLTKRKVLSYISELYDPLGLASPIGIRGRSLMRELWLIKMGWDDKLDDECVKKFNQLIPCYSKIAELQFPRACCLNKDHIQLHVFCDASAQAYGAVAYAVTADSSIIIISKARVSPVKTKSIPQLELTAIVIGCRLVLYLLENLKCSVSEIFVWTDNMPCLSWIENNKSNLVYVRNRVGEILEIQKETKLKLRHVSTHENPADLLSRGCTLRQLKQSEMWTHGPKWLLDKDSWPNPAVVEDDHTIPFIGEIVTQNFRVEVPEPIFPVNSYSTLKRLYRVTTLVFEFIRKLRPGALSCETPEAYWRRCEQRTHYPLVVRCLQKDSHENMYQSSWRFIRDLNLYLDKDGILRSKGRYGRKQELMALNNVVLLPPKSFYTHLIILALHANNHHIGVAQTLGDLREFYWVPKGRPVVKSSISKCLLCRLFRAQTYSLPGPASLPDYRVHYTRPFEVSGVDFTGAISLKDEAGVIHKYYVCLFTCTATRAVHLELCCSLSAEAFINCLRRFVARCSLPRRLVSDNGTNFVATHKFIVALQRHVDIKSYLYSHNVAWTFNTPRAPWQGGMFERLIKIVKDCLVKALFRRSINMDELATILTEVEAIVNNRPLTYVSGLIEDGEPLCPAKLLYGRKIHIFPPVDRDDNDLDYVDTREHVNILVDHYARVSACISHFYRVWCKEYLSALREKHYTSYQQTIRTPKVGEIVYIKEGNDKSLYKLAKIVELTPSSDGYTREVKVISEGEIYRKSLDKLVPLEVTLPEAQEVSVSPPTSSPERRNRRQAAIACDRERKVMIQDGSLE